MKKEAVFQKQNTGELEIGICTQDNINWMAKHIRSLPGVRNVKTEDYGAWKIIDVHINGDMCLTATYGDAVVMRPDGSFTILEEHQARFLFPEAYDGWY